MPTRRLTLSAAAALLLAPTAALAAASDWHHVEGGAIRLVTDDAPGDDGVLRGALEIRLKPGWKTYWRDPGSSGVPPSLAVTVGGQKAEVEIAFPAPTRFDDGYAVWAGYDRSVALALTMRLPPDADLPASAVAEAFLGVCETICIPVKAELTADDGAGEAEHTATVDAAFAALPQPERPDFGIRPGGDGGDGAIVVEATLPAGVEAIDLFVAGTDTLVLGVPERLGGSASTPARFAVPVLYGPANGTAEDLAYTLVTSSGAVSGRFSLP